MFLAVTLVAVPPLALAAATIPRDLRTVQDHGRSVLCSDLTDPAQCAASNASFCADAPVLDTMSCDTFAACEMEGSSRPSFAYYSPGDTGSSESGRRRLQPARKNEALYCSPNGSFAVKNPKYFLTPFCADGFQIVEGGVWPPAEGGWAETFEITGLDGCAPGGQCGHHSDVAQTPAGLGRRRLFNGPPHPPAPPTCASSWTGITDPGPSPPTAAADGSGNGLAAAAEAAGPLCALALELVCGKEEKEGSAKCLACAGLHASSLQKSCTQAQLESLCKGGPKPPTPPSPPSPPPGPGGCEFYVYANMTLAPAGSCFHACLTPDVAAAAGIAGEKGTCENTAGHRRGAQALTRSRTKGPARRTRRRRGSTGT